MILEQPLASGSRSAQSLAPGIDALLAEVGWSISQIDLVAVTQGPGSFTGLRIGVTTAKALAYAGGAKVMGVNTLEVIARQAPGQSAATTERTLWAVIDAQRGELFVARFAPGSVVSGGGPVEVETIDQHSWLTRLVAGEAVTGPGLQRCAVGIRPGVTVVGEEHWLPRAETVGRLGHEQFAGGRRDDLFQLSPLYYRRAAAEENWQRQHPALG